MAISDRGPGTRIAMHAMCVLWPLLHPLMVGLVLINTPIKGRPDGSMHNVDKH